MAIKKMLTIDFQSNEDLQKATNDYLLFPDEHDDKKAYCLKSEVEAVKSLLELEEVEADIHEPIYGIDEPKVILKHNVITKPFYEAVEANQVKFNYFDIDPTDFFFISFGLLFGIMFGDIGQGILLIIYGALSKKSRNKIFTRVGFFSIIFGWLYGSIFGDEEIIPEFMHKHKFNYSRFGLLERENTSTLLQIVLGIGAILIIISMILNIIDLIREKKYLKSIFANNGFAGILFYGSLFLAAILDKTMGISNIGIIIFTITILTGTLLMFLYEIVCEKKGLLEGWHYLAHSYIEFASHSMAFLMIGCFALAHATLMLYTFKIASHIPNFKWLIIIIGNLIVMGIESTEVYHECVSLLMNTLYPIMNSQAEKQH